MKIGRNTKCPCESGKKFKRCCIHTEKGKIIQQNFGQPFIDFVINTMKEDRKNNE